MSERHPDHALETAREITDFRRRHSGFVRLLVDESAGPEVAQFLEESFNTKYVHFPKIPSYRRGPI
jgi:hypothetical protein